MTIDKKRSDFDIINVPLTGSNLVEASAGTGKTWSSTGLYLRMVVEQELKPENILVVTFTRAATAELAGRIRERLQGMHNYLLGAPLQEDKQLYENLVTKWSQLGLHKDTIISRIHDAISCFDKAAIYTIHSFCQRLLNDYSFEASARFDLTPISDDSEFRQLVAEDFWRKHLGTLSADSAQDQQWLKWLIDKGQKPSALLASVDNYIGKRSFVTQSVPELPQVDGDIVALYQQALMLWQSDQTEIISQFTLAFDEVLNGTSYNKKQKDEYLQSLCCLLDDGQFNWTDKSEKSTASAMAAKVKKGQTDKLATHPFFELLDQALEVINQQEQQFAVRLQRLRAALLNSLDSNLPQMKSSLSLLGFNDMMQNVYDALTGAQGDSLATAVGKQFKAAIIDEFQDTDPLQLKIFSRLFVEQKAILFYVGDPKQAIYSFRGADIYAYYEAANNTNKQHTLRTNYRSTANLVNSVNALFSSKHDAFISKDIAFDWVNTVNKSVLDIKGDEDSAFTIAMPKNPEIDKNGNIKGLTRQIADPWASRYTACKIAQLLNKAKNGEALLKKGKKQRPLQPGDFAVLVPSHRDGDNIKKELDALGIPSVRQSKDKVLESVAAYTLLRLMQAVANPGNESKIVELLGDGLIGLSGSEIIALKKNDKAWESELEFFWKLREIWLDNGFSTMFRCWLETPDRSDLSVAQRLVALAQGERYLTDLMHLSEIIQSHSTELASMQAQISWLQHVLTDGRDEDEYQLRLESDSERVKIVTVHSSKGLEYNIVFCPFLWTGRKPHADSIVSAHKNGQTLLDFGTDLQPELSKLKASEALMEQLRLLYVALTRPVHRLYLFWPNVAGKTEYSALAWLIYGEQNMLDNEVIQLAQKVKSLPFEEFYDAVAKLQKKVNKGRDAKGNDPADISVHILEEMPAQQQIQTTQQSTEILSVAAIPTHKISPAWWQSSFSALVKGQHAIAAVLPETSEHCDDQATPLATPLVTAQAAETEMGDPYSIFALPRGATTGEALHSIFEFWDFSKDDDNALKELILEQLNQFNVGKTEDRHHWLPAVLAMVKNTLGCALDKKDLYLNRIPAGKRLPEMEFILAGRASLDDICRLLMQPQYGLPIAFIEACKQLKNRDIEGYLNGFIDLVFEDNASRFHVLDWKSNHLGMNYSDYQDDNMIHAMAHSHYYLQALIYLVALHRYLKNKLSHYDPTLHLGNAWYLFIRGVDGENGQGVFEFNPPVSLIEALDKALQVKELS